MLHDTYLAGKGGCSKIQVSDLVFWSLMIMVRGGLHVSQFFFLAPEYAGDEVGLRNFLVPLPWVFLLGSAGRLYKTWRGPALVLVCLERQPCCSSCTLRDEHQFVCLSCCAFAN